MSIQVRTLEAQLRSAHNDLQRKAETVQRLEAQILALQAQLEAATVRATSSEQAVAELGRQAEAQAAAVEEMCARLSEVSSYSRNLVAIISCQYVADRIA